MLAGDPGFGGWCRLEGALVHRCALIVNIPHGLAPNRSVCVIIAENGIFGQPPQKQQVSGH
jgi:hypothetical protein